MSKPIDELKHEHDAILFALEILESMAGQISGGKTVEIVDISGFLGFLQEFVDKCHHGKEEGILFPALINAGIPAEGGPVSVMLSEHAQGRGFIKQMDMAIAPGLNNEEFTRAASGYMHLLRQHIQKENTVLFPMAEHMLTPAQLDRIYVLFEEHEEKVIGHGRHEELHALLKKLREKYLG